MVDCFLWNIYVYQLCYTLHSNILITRIRWTHVKPKWNAKNDIWMQPIYNDGLSPQIAHGTPSTLDLAELRMRCDYFLAHSEIRWVRGRYQIPLPIKLNKNKNDDNNLHVVRYSPTFPSQFSNKLNAPFSPPPPIFTSAPHNWKTGWIWILFLNIILSLSRSQFIPNHVKKYW